MKVKVGMCFPDNNAMHMATLRNLLNYYISVDGSAGEVTVDMTIEDDRLVIDVSKGFHCLFIPIGVLKKLLAGNQKTKKQEV